MIIAPTIAILALALVIVLLLREGKRERVAHAAQITEMCERIQRPDRIPAAARPLSPPQAEMDPERARNYASIGSVRPPVDSAA